METYDRQSHLEENVDYELIPGEGENWDVRLLEGPFPETVVQFLKIKVSDDTEYLTFDFNIVTSPDPELTDENLDLQQHVADVLQSILENSITKLAEREEE